MIGFVRAEGRGWRRDGETHREEEGERTASSSWKGKFRMGNGVGLHG